MNFVQKKKEEHIKPRIKSDPVTKLPTAENFVLSEDKVQKLSEIIAEINSIAGKDYDNDVAVKAMLQIKDIMMKSDKLKTLGQLLEYNHYPNKNNADKLIIVTALEITQQDMQYLIGVRSRYGIPVYYQQFDMNKKFLSKEY